MLTKRIFILSGLLLVISLALYGIITGMKKIKVDDFKPASVIFLIDSSASNQENIHRTTAKPNR